MSEEPVDLTTPQPPVYSEPLPSPPPPPRSVGIQQLLDRLATMATERATATRDPEAKQKSERVARLARELSEALSAVEVNRDPDGPQPA
jgi:hypothetical protein